MVTKEVIQKRILELQEARQKLIDDANAYTGAIQDCEFWLNELGKEQPKE